MKVVQKKLYNKTENNAFNIVFVIGNCQIGTPRTAVVLGYQSKPIDQ